MVSKLNLKGNNLLTFALIYGFSQDGESKFYGSISYVQKWLNVSEPTAIATTKNLVELGLIKKEQATIDKVLRNFYTVDWGGVERLTSKETLVRPLKKFKGGSKEILEGGSKEILDNNTNIDNTKEKIDKTPNGEHPFSKIPGLEQRIGSKQYELLRKLSEQNLEAMRGMFHDGRVEMLWTWLEHKKTKGAYRAINGITATVNMLKEYTPAELQKSLSKALIGNYDGWFPEKEQQPKRDAPIHNLTFGQRRRID